MDLTLSERELEWQSRARDFCEQVLQPMEIGVEEHGGLPDSERATLLDKVREWKLNAINHRVDDAGQGCSILEQTLINEQLGRATCGLWSAVWQPANCLRHGTDAQIADYLHASCRGERRGCYAITEPGAGSDTGRVRSTAVLDGDGYVINGEKWFVTSFNASDFIILHVLVDGDVNKPTLFLVDKDCEGIEHLRSPKFMHTYAFDHAELRFSGLRVRADAVLGGVGQGLELTKDWFVEARLQIAAHCVGAATRCAELANQYAAGREQFGQTINSYQGIEFMLADMATEIMAAKTLLYRSAHDIDAGLERKLVHARASALKLFCSEMAGRVADRAVQIFGGRGYMRDNPVERLYRDLRVDRIWEGTSEIQRVIIGGQIKKRGLDIYTGW